MHLDWLETGAGVQHNGHRVDEPRPAWRVKDSYSSAPTRALLEYKLPWHTQLEDTPSDINEQNLSPGRARLTPNARETLYHEHTHRSSFRDEGRFLKFLSNIGLREKDIPPGHVRIRWKDVFSRCSLFKVTTAVSNYP